VRLIFEESFLREKSKLSKKEECYAMQYFSSKVIKHKGGVNHKNKAYFYN